jgi:hypothetical protein
MEILRFTIERFGLVKLTHSNLAAALTETAEMRNADIVGTIRNDGWALYVFGRVCKECGDAETEFHKWDCPLSTEETPDVLPEHCGPAWWESNISRIELVAIWAECNGYGED